MGIEKYQSQGRSTNSSAGAPFREVKYGKGGIKQPTNVGWMGAVALTVKSIVREGQNLPEYYFKKISLKPLFQWHAWTTHNV